MEVKEKYKTNVINIFENEKYVLEGKITDIQTSNRLYLIKADILNVLENKDIFNNLHILNGLLEDKDETMKNIGINDIVLLSGTINITEKEKIEVKTNEKWSYRINEIKIDKIEIETSKKEKKSDKKEEIINTKKEKKEKYIIIDRIEESDTIDDDELIKKHENDVPYKREFKKVYNQALPE